MIVRASLLCSFMFVILIGGSLAKIVYLSEVEHKRRKHASKRDDSETNKGKVC